MTATPDPGAQRLFDAWLAVHPNEPHPPTMGVFEKTWPLYCCDFAFVTRRFGREAADHREHVRIAVGDHLRRQRERSPQLRLHPDAG